MNYTRFSMRTLLALPLSAGLVIYLLDFILIAQAVHHEGTTIALSFLVLMSKRKCRCRGRWFFVKVRSVCVCFSFHRSGRPNDSCHPRQLADYYSVLMTRTHIVDYSRWKLTVDADHYQTMRENLCVHTTDRSFHCHDSVPPPIVIRVSRH